MPGCSAGSTFGEVAIVICLAPFGPQSAFGQTASHQGWHGYFAIGLRLRMRAYQGLVGVAPSPRAMAQAVICEREVQFSLA